MEDSIFKDIVIDHVDENGVTFIDGFKSDDPNEEGVIIGYFIKGEVYWRDAEYQFDSYVKDVVKYLKEAEANVDLIDQVVYSERVTFQDILDGASSEVKERYEALSKEDKKAFVKKNFHGCKTGFEFGICDPISDIYSTLRSSLEF